MSPPQITELFAQRDKHPYNLRHNAQILQPLVNSVSCGTESISYFGPRIWGMVPGTYKNIDNLYNLTLLKNGSLKTVHAEFARSLSKIKNFVNLFELLCSLGQ